MHFIINAAMDRRDGSVHERPAKAAKVELSGTVSSLLLSVFSKTSESYKMQSDNQLPRHEHDETNIGTGDTVDDSALSRPKIQTIKTILPNKSTLVSRSSGSHHKSHYPINMLSTIFVASIILVSTQVLRPSFLSNNNAVSADLILDPIRTSGQYELPSSSIDKKEDSLSGRNIKTEYTSDSSSNPTTALMIVRSSNSHMGQSLSESSRTLIGGDIRSNKPVAAFELSTSASEVSSTESIVPSPTQLDDVALDAADSKKKKKMMKKKKKMEKKHKEWKKGKKHKKKKFEEKKKKGEMSKKKKGKKEKKKWGMEKKGHKKKGNFKKKKWGEKKKMKKGQKKGKKGHKMLKDKGHKKKGFKKIYHKEEWGKKKKWHDIKREKKWNTKQKKWKKKWHQEKGKKYKGKHMKKYHKKNKHGKKYKKEKKEKFKKHKGEKFKKGHKKKKEEYSKKKEGGKKKKEKKMKKEMKKKKG